jgi:hypothetical protein
MTPTPADDDFAFLECRSQSAKSNCATQQFISQVIGTGKKDLASVIDSFELARFKSPLLETP